MDNTGSRVRLSAPRFVGRASARQTVQDALSTPPAVVLVEGEAGIGKSRLVQECLPDAGEPAAGVLVGGCPPHREPATLAPIVDALRGAGDRLPALRLTPLAGALRPLFPEWAARLPGPPEPLADPKAARYRLFRALAELIERLDAGVLVVEDLHWADEVSLEFLLFLATRQGSPHKLGLVATYRPEDLPGGSLVRRLSSRAPAGTTQARVVLPSLTLDHPAELAASMLGGEPVSPPLAALLHE
ncbi:MAG: AAA family ATPase, partial [Natronosporangium sp.]